MSDELDIPDVELSDFTSSAELSGERISLRLVGNADLGARQELENVLRLLHSEAQRLEVTEVVLDIMQLEFMNSSCFKGFVSWLCDVRELPADRQYQIQFRSNSEMLWQRRSMHALQAFAANVVSVVT